MITKLRKQYAETNNPADKRIIAIRGKALVLARDKAYPDKKLEEVIESMV